MPSRARRSLSRPSLSRQFLSAGLLALVAGCSFPDPPKSLRSLMIEQELALVQLEQALRDPARAVPGDERVELAEAIAAISASEAFREYESRTAVAPRVAEFRALRERYVAESEALVEAAREGRPEDLTAVLTRLRRTCDGCHVQFRPGL